MSTDKFKELDYYGLAYFWNKIKNKFALKTETNITGSNGITVTMPTETSGTSVVVSYDNNDNVVNHIANNDVHVTSSDKTNWNDKYTKTEVDNKISGLVNSAPETLDTLNELATALGNDPNFATTVANQIGTKANSSDVYTKTQVDTSLNSKANTSDLTTHTSNSDIHVTSTDKSTWNGKQSALSTAQLNACNSGITSTKVSGYDTHVANSDVHVTTSDKSTWNAKQNSLTDTQLSACNSGITSDKVATYDGYATSKANNSSVVHTSGDETIEGTKTFNSGIISQEVHNTDANFRSLISVGSTWGDLSFIWINGKNANGWNSIKGGISINPYDGTNLGTFDFRPNQEFINSSNNGALGTSSNKWKTINGVNPGALSLPTWNDGTHSIKGYITDLTGNDWNEIPNTLNSAWIYIQTSNTQFITIGTGNKFYTQNNLNGTTFSIFLPTTYNISIKVKCSSVDICELLPTFGN